MPAANCIVAAKAALSVIEKKTGKEKLKAKLRGFDAPTAQSDFGNPVSGVTRYDLCIYDSGDNFVAELNVDRPGQACGPKQRDCWKDKGGSGWKFKDPSASANGVKNITAVSGGTGKGKIQLKAGNKAKKGQVAMPTGIAQALQGAASAKAQVVTSDAQCFEAVLGTVKKADGVKFMAKKR